MTGWPAATQQSFLAQQFDAQHRHYRTHYRAAEWLVIEQAGQPVGRLCLEQRPNNLRVIDLALLPEARGRCIGGTILNDLIAGARSRGKSTSAYVEKNNRAMDLYRRPGFVRINEHGVNDLMEWRPAPGTIS